jgi:hypothetical protein
VIRIETRIHARPLRSMSDRPSTVRPMVVYSNRRMGAAAELLVSSEVACAMLADIAAAARPLAQGRWELELVLWLEDRAQRMAMDLDVEDLAWSPENFERQKRFVIESIERAALTSPHARALHLWCRLFEAHAREHVVVGRRWQWIATQPNAQV